MKNIITLILLFPTIVFSQIGFIVDEFNTGTGTSLSTDVLSSAIQEDGKILIGGAFLKYNGVNVRRILRLTASGLIDYSFSPNNGADAEVLDIKLKNDKIFICGFFSEYNNQIANGVCKLNSNGTIDQSFSSMANSNSGIYTLEFNNDKIYIGGNIPFYDGVSVNNIALLNSDGSIDNSFNTGLGFNGQVYAVKKQMDGKVLVGGAFTSYNGFSSNRILRLNENGSVDNSFNIGAGAGDEIRSIQIQEDGKILLFGKFTSFNGQNFNRIIRLNSDGSIDTSFISNSGANDWILTSKILNDGSIMIGGRFTAYQGIYKGKIAKLDNNGQLIESFVLNYGFNNIVNSICQTEENKILITGSFNQFDSLNYKGLIMLDNNLKGVYGRFFEDVNENCINDVQENSFNNAVFTITPGNEIVTTNNQGYFFINHLSNGDYQINYDTTQFYRISCNQNISFTITDEDTITKLEDIGMYDFYACPKPSISVHMPLIRPCFTNQQIYIQSCNDLDASKTLAAPFSLIELDPSLIFESSSLPFVNLGNNQFRFEHDSLFPGDCVNFTISAQVSCEAILGQTICISASLLPVPDCVFDTIPDPPNSGVSPCTTAWDHSNLTVRGWCLNDSIYFTIVNTSELGIGDMDCYSPVRVFVDGVLMQLGSVLLQGGQTFDYVFAGTAQTWILQVDQHPLHPGNSQPNAHVENCGSGSWTPDLVNDLPLDDADPFVDIFCGIVTGSYDPNDKRGFPNGISDDHFIAKNQDLQYVIRFQNTGTDTAFTVVVRDTLDFNFNIFTVTPGVSSHPYSFRMYGPRVLEWTFANILLPDSTTNEALSHGFLTFTVKQNPSLAEGTLLKNDADIYFDFNEPIITNETDHKISYQINELSLFENFKTTKENLRLYPNPTNSMITVDLNTFSKVINYKIFSLSGKVLQEKNNSYGKKFSIDIKNLENGLYFLELEYENKIEILNFIKN